jgi:hypothetical protein
MFLVVDGYRLSPWDFFTPQKLGFLGPPEPELHLHRIQQNSRFATSQVSIFMLSFSGSTFFHSSSCQILPDSARFCQILGMLKHMGSETHEAMLEAREVEGKAQQVDGWQPVTPQCSNDAGLFRRIHPNSWAHLYLWEPD